MPVQLIYFCTDKLQFEKIARKNCSIRAALILTPPDEDFA